MNQPKLKRHLNTIDATFYFYERKEAPFHVGSTMIFDGVITYEEFTSALISKLPLLPRYTQKVVPAPFNIGQPCWEFDPNFDVRRHVFAIQMDPPGSMEQLRVLFSQIESTMLERDKPLWEVYVVNGLEGNRTAIISKVHHCMVDGIASVDLLNVMLDQSPNPPPPPKPRAMNKRSPNNLAGLMVDSLLGRAEESLKNWTEMQLGLLNLGQALLKNPASPITKPSLNPIITLTTPVTMLPFNQNNSGQLDIAWDQFSFNDAHAIRDVLGGTVNDVMLTAVSAAVTYYMEAHGYETEGKYVRYMVPVNMRHEDHHGTWGNMISVYPVQVPLNIKDPLERYHYVVQATREMKEGKVADQFNLVVNLIGVLPGLVQATAGSLIFTEVPLVNMVCTNVPGPHQPLYILGKKLIDSYPYVPFAYAVGLTCTIFSYDHKLFISLSSDARKMPGIGKEFIQYMDQAFAELQVMTEKPEISLIKSEELPESPATVVPKEVIPTTKPEVTARPVAARAVETEVIEPVVEAYPMRDKSESPVADTVLPAAEVIAAAPETTVRPEVTEPLAETPGVTPEATPPAIEAVVEATPPVVEVPAEALEIREAAAETSPAAPEVSTPAVEMPLIPVKVQPPVTESLALLVDAEPAVAKNPDTKEDSQPPELAEIKPTLDKKARMPKSNVQPKAAHPVKNNHTKTTS
ncbi:MAG TPA: wax ester/triacylglycerol synthase family O-acyltransferase [Chloroflexia bacterium]|nr:wax ester/triacylglycerol synthase family O-acyltransferase [Chloroflexia bacterium]